MASSTQFYRNLVGIANIGVGATTVPTSNIQVTGNVYASNALVSPLILGTSLVGTHYGVIAGSNTVSASSITCTSLSAGAGTVSGAHSGSGASLTNLPLNQFTGLTAGGVAYGSATTTIATNSAGTSGQALLSGGAGAPTWGTLGLAYGGTGQTTAQAAINTLAGAVSSAQYLRGNGTNVVMSAIQASDVPTLNQNTTGSSGSCTGNSATATTAAACSGNSATATSAGSCTGNSATATTAAACSGNSATATTATNQSGGTVAATTGSFSSTITLPGTGTNQIYAGTGDNATFTTYNVGIQSWWGLGFRSYDGTVRTMLDTRTGNFWTLGTVGVGTNSAASTYTLQVTGSIGATGDVVAYTSDERLKKKVGYIENALDKVCSLTAFKYVHNETARQNGFTGDVVHVGLSAQEVQKVLPEVIKPAPFDVETEKGGGVTKSKSGENYLTVQYERIVSLLIEALKEERKAREALEERISQLELKERISM